MQRGLLLWVLSLHEPRFRLNVSPKKLPNSTADPQKAAGSKSTPAKSKKLAKTTPTSADIDSDQEGEPAADELPTLNGRLSQVPPPVPEDVSSSLPTNTATPGPLGLPSRPPPLTPSVTRVLSRASDAPPPPPLPAGLTISSLRSRLGKKSKVKYVPQAFDYNLIDANAEVRRRGAFMTPREMEELTESWKPYRSIGKLRKNLLSQGQVLTASQAFTICGG